MCRLTYGVYCTGGSFPDRPEPIYRDSILELNFQTASKFYTFYQRALSWTPSRLVEFGLNEISSRRVEGQISANHTPEMTLMSPQDLFPGIDSDAVILRVDHMV